MGCFANLFVGLLDGCRWSLSLTRRDLQHCVVALHSENLLWPGSMLCRVKGLSE